jgi:hypothetical protein
MSYRMKDVTSTQTSKFTTFYQSVSTVVCLGRVKESDPYSFAGKKRAEVRTQNIRIARREDVRHDPLVLGTSLKNMTGVSSHLCHAEHVVLRVVIVVISH